MENGGHEAKWKGDEIHAQKTFGAVEGKDSHKDGRKGLC